MDSGFKRLWARTRNKSNIPVQRSTPVNDNARSHSRPSMSTMDGRPSMALSSNLPDRSPSQDLVRNLRDYSSVASDEYNQPKSGHRIQPILVGISRPTQHPDRPATAESMSTAIQQAADSVSHKSSEPSGNQSGPTEYYKKPRSPRYVDIFTVASSVPAYKSRFNEEIAERNLDVLRVAMEGEQTDYVPSSKYQEEVASRNAGLPYNAQTSDDHGRLSTDMNGHVRSSSRISKETQNSQRSGIQTQQPAIGKPQNGTVQQGLSHQPRPHSQHSNNGSFGSSSASHGWHFEADQPSVDLNADAIANSSRSRSKPASRGQSNAQHAIHTIVEKPRRNESFTSDEMFNNVRDFGTVTKPSANGYFNYTLSAAELGSRLQSRQTPLRLIDVDQPLDHRNMEPHSRGPSVTSNRSYRKPINLQNRTIMDLTGDEELISEASSSYGSINTPVIEQAKWGAIQRIAPQQTSSYSRVISNETTPTPTPQEFQKTSNPSYVEHVNSTPRSDEQPVKQVSKIAFSPISTLASLSPRSSMIVSKGQPLTMVQRVTAAVEARNASSSVQTPSIPESNAIPEESKTHFDTTFADAHSGESTPKADTSMASIPGSHTPMVEAGEQLPTLISSKPVSEAEISSPDSGYRIVHRMTPSIYESPQSLNSVDYTNPGDSFGIRTRDFAVTPRESVASLKKSEPRSLQRSAAENAAKAASPSQKKRPTTGTSSRSKQRTPARKVSSAEFDEEAFARKQADARAALERLQRSLEEDFMTASRPEPPRNRTSYGSDTDGRPVAPKSSSVPINMARTSPTNQRMDAERSPLSYRGSSLDTVHKPSMSSSRSRSGGGTSRKAAPPSLKNLDTASTPISAAPLPASLLHVIDTKSRPPRSPGEISLSSFPLPISRPTSEHEQVNGSQLNPSMLGHLRRDSAKSQASITSQYSIPSHMIPDRHSSVRETVAEEDEEGFSI